MSKMTEEMQLVKAMHEKFGIPGGDKPHFLSEEEMNFRVTCLQEELDEFRDHESLEDKFDALIDLKVFADGTLERMGMSGIALEGYKRVMDSNLQKELGGNEKRGNFQIDLVKPEGWTAPDHSDLVTFGVNPKGLIVIDGPDAAGKSTLCEYFVEKYGAHYKHLTWSPLLEDHMESYQVGAIVECLEIAKTRLVVLDRAWMSEVIYASIYRNGSQYPDLAPKCFELLESAVNIVAIPTRSKWLANFIKMSNEREEMFAGDTDGMQKIRTMYADLYWGDIQTGNEFTDRLSKTGGLSQFCNYKAYDMFTDGRDVPEYALNVLQLLYEMNEL